MNDLKPCPFCTDDNGALISDDHDEHWRVECPRCDALGPMMGNRDAAIAAWNSRRATDARTEVDAARYRWLRTRQTEIIINSPISPERSEALDIAIDNAMRDRQP